MEKRTLPRRLAAAALAAALALGLAACGGAQEIRFGTGNTAGTYYGYGTALAELSAPDLPEGAAFSVKSTAGSAANIRLLKEGFLQLALVQNDTLDDAEKGAGAFVPPAPDGSSTLPAATPAGYSAVAALYMESCQVVVPADSGITSVANLRGKTVSVGEAESGVLQNARQILLAHGLTLEMLTPKYLSFSASAEALQSGELDAFFLTAGAPTGAVETLAERMAVRILDLDGAVVDALTETYGYYAPHTLPAGTYPGQDAPVSTVGIKSVLVAADALPADVVAALTASLFDHGAELQFSAPGSARPDPAFASEGVSIPFHPGAAGYYAQQGVTVEVRGDA